MAGVFGDPIPGCEPYWYQGYPSAYYSASHETFRAKCRSFVEAEVQPYLEEWIAKKAYPLELHQKALAAGLPTAGLQKDRFLLWTGHGSRWFRPAALMRCMSSSTWTSWRLQDLEAPWVVDEVIAGRHSDEGEGAEGGKNISLAISEPSAGSDVANIGASAVAEKDVYVVNGQKKWITGGHMADYFTLAVRTGAAGAGGLSLLLVDARTPGVRVRSGWEKLTEPQHDAGRLEDRRRLMEHVHALAVGGARHPQNLKKADDQDSPQACWRMEMQFDSCHGTTFLDFEDVRVPKANLIGEEGKGFKYLMFNFNHERFVISVSTCRFARLCYAEALKYSLRRKTFGKALHDSWLQRGDLGHWI
eukprot:g24889.t1